MVTTVLLADFQFLTRQGIVSLVQSMPNFKILNNITDANELEPAISRYLPDMVVLDISGQDNILTSILGEIKSKYQVKFLIISNNHSCSSVKMLLDIGVRGIITKSCSQEEITNALYAVGKGDRFYCSKILDLAIGNHDEKNQLNFSRLSPREHEILLLIAKGYTTSKIADQLFLSIHTINSHRKNMLKKLNVKSPVELVSYAIQGGFIN